MAGVIPYTHESWKRTNADRIRSMSDEELAELLVHNPWMREETALDWLKQEVTNNSTT